MVLENGCKYLKLSNIKVEGNLNLKGVKSKLKYLHMEETGLFAHKDVETLLQFCHSLQKLQMFGINQKMIESICLLVSILGVESLLPFCAWFFLGYKNRPILWYLGVKKNFKVGNSALKFIEFVWKQRRYLIYGSNNFIWKFQFVMCDPCLPKVELIKYLLSCRAVLLAFIELSSNIVIYMMKQFFRIGQWFTAYLLAHNKYMHCKQSPHNLSVKMSLSTCV